MQTLKKLLLASPVIWVIGAVILMIAVSEQSQFYLLSVVICLILILMSMLIIASTVSRIRYSDKFWMNLAAASVLIICEFALACFILYSAFVAEFGDQFAASFMLDLSKLLIMVIMVVCAVAIGLVVHNIQNYQTSVRRRF